MFDLLGATIAMNNLHKGKQAALSDMQIVNCVVSLPFAKEKLDASSYNEVEAKYLAYNAKKDKKKYDSFEDFQSRASEIAYDFNYITEYENICGSVPLELKVFFEFCKGSYERLEDNTYKAMMVMVDDISNYLTENNINCNYCDLYGISITLISIFLSYLVHHETNPNYMCTHEHMRSLTRENLKEVVSWHAFYRYENVVDAFCREKFPIDYDAGTWAKKAALLLNDYSSTSTKNLSEKEKCFEISNAYLQLCSIETNSELSMIFNTFIDFCIKLLE